MNIILGSASENRRRILEEMGCEFEVMSADIDEKAIRADDPKELTIQLAHAKADALLPRIEKPALLITSDQVVVWNGIIREKPENADEAREFLRGYAEHPAETVTAVCVTNTETGKRECGVDIARVEFAEIPERVIDELIASGRVFRWAGGFAVRDPLIAPHVRNIEGEVESVEGLPRALTERLLEAVDKRMSSALL